MNSNDKEKTKIAFVTGGSGFIGSQVIRELINAGIHVRALMRKTSSDENVKGLEYEPVIGDLHDLDALKKGVLGAHYVFHLAGLTSAKKRQDYFKFNQEGTKNIAQAIVDSGASIERFVYVSSLAAAGPSEDLTPKVETDFERPISAYGESKLAGEKELLKIANDRFAVSIIRPPAVYGPRDRDIFEFFKFIQSGIMPIFPSSNPTKKKHYSLVHVEDLVQGILKAGLAPDQGRREVYYLSADEIQTMDEIFNEIAMQLGKRPFKVYLPTFLLKSLAGFYTGLGKITGRKYPLTLDKLHELRPDFWICSNKLAKTKLGFQPRYTLSKGVEQTTQWYKDNHWLK